MSNLAGTDSSFRYRHDREFVYGETRPVEPANWTMAVVEPASVCGHPRSVRSVALVAAFNLLMALVLARLLARWCSLFLRCSGRLAVSRRATMTRPYSRWTRELADLAESFKTMTEALAEQREDLGVSV